MEDVCVCERHVGCVQPVSYHRFTLESYLVEWLKNWRSHLEVVIPPFGTRLKFFHSFPLVYLTSTGSRQGSVPALAFDAV